MSVIVPSYNKCNELSPLKNSIKRLLDEGEKIKKTEIIPGDEIGISARVNGPSTNKWVADLKVLNERYLKAHPLYQEINEKLFHFKHRLSVFEELIGLLESLFDDDTLEGDSMKDSRSNIDKNMTIEQMISEDIEKCEAYLDGKIEYQNGKKLYESITSKYDSEIADLGNNLYQYYSDRHFYDSQLSKDALDHNIRVIMYKLKRKKSELAMSNQHDKSTAKLTDNKPHMLFISHSSEDKVYMSALVEMLEDIGMPKGSFVCTSIPGYGIPGGCDTFDWLREQFENNNLRVLFSLSENYYRSPACLNEMGAAWITKSTATLLLLPGFSFGDIKGCVNPREIGISFDSDDQELKHRLNEFKDFLVSEHSLQPIIPIRWERHRDNLIRTVREIAVRKNQEINSDEPETESHLPTVGKEDVKDIPTESAFLLVYAAEYGGYIRRISDIDGAVPFFVVEGKRFMSDFSHKEFARWQEALDRLIKWRWVKLCDNSSEVFELTGTGYQKAEMLKEGMSIDTTREPLDEIKEFDT